MKSTRHRNLRSLLGKEVKVRGLDMDCRPTVEVCRVVRVLEVNDPKYGKYDCVLQGKDGIKVLTDSSDFLFV